jgi:hypothetical protein
VSGASCGAPGRPRPRGRLRVWGGGRSGYLRIGEGRGSGAAAAMATSPRGIRTRGGEFGTVAGGPEHRRRPAGVSVRSWPSRPVVVLTNRAGRGATWAGEMTTMPFPLYNSIPSFQLLRVRVSVSSKLSNLHLRKNIMRKMQAKHSKI